jgi:hypothetical protein
MESQLQKREDFQQLIDYPGQVAERAKQLGSNSQGIKKNEPPSCKS